MTGKRPAPILTAAGKSGAVLTVGNVCLLSGEGGIAKSALALSLAAGIAELGEHERGQVCGLFEGPGGPALLATFEDHPTETAWRARCLIGQLTTGRISHDRTLSRVHVLDLAGRPLFGPKDDGGRYNERPGRLAGWWDLWSEARRIKPRLIVIDPALAAYVGEANAAAPVREFLTALATEAAELNTGVLLLAHSNKAARSSNSRKPKPQDLLDPGHVGGSTAWTDGVRGVLAMAWKPGGDAGKTGLDHHQGQLWTSPAHLRPRRDPPRNRGDCRFQKLPERMGQDRRQFRREGGKPLWLNRRT